MNEHLNGTALVAMGDWEKDLQQPGWFIIADAAINNNVRSLVDDDRATEQRLYWGQMGEQHASISPYLLPMPEWQWLSDNITSIPHWGVAVQLHESFHSYDLDDQIRLVMQHFRAWTLAELPNQDTVILRLTDWDIFNVLWNATTNERLADLQGPIQTIGYWSTGEDNAIVRRCDFPLSAIPMVMPNRLDDTQYQALSWWNERKIFQQYQDHLFQQHEITHDWEQDVWQTFIQTHVTQARQLGFQQQAEVATFLSLTVLLGDTFYLAPWAQTILQSPQFVGNESRMDRLVAEAVNHIDEESTPS